MELIYLATKIIASILLALAWCSLIHSRSGFIRRVPNAVLAILASAAPVATALTETGLYPLPLLKVYGVVGALLGLAFMPKFTEGLKWALSTPTQYSELKAYFWETKIKVEHIPNNKGEWDIVRSTAYGSTTYSWPAKQFKEIYYEEIK